MAKVYVVHAKKERNKRKREYVVRTIERIGRKGEKTKR
jgi:hypothetical protein